MRTPLDAMINQLFMPGMLVGLLSPFAAIPIAIVLYVRHRQRIEPARQVPLAAYVLLLLVFAPIAGYAGMVGGMMLACPQAGNLCGLFGVFATGPLSFSLAVVGLGLALLLIRPAPKP
jgi:hypothetical protein